jgi:hypothetical protein
LTLCSRYVDGPPKLSAHIRKPPRSGYLQYKTIM